MRIVVLPDEPTLEPEDCFQFMMEPYVVYFLAFGKEEIGQGVSVAVQLENGLVLPPLVAGAVISSDEDFAFFTVEILQEMVRRVYAMVRDCEVIIDEAMENATRH